MLILFWCLTSYAQEYAVVSNVLLSEISPLEIRAVFLKKLTHINNHHIVPVNLPSNNPVRKAFEKEILHMSKKRLKQYWIRQHYLGKRPPIVMKSQKASLLFTQNIQGAISYVEIKNVSNAVQVLYRWKD